MDRRRFLIFSGRSPARPRFASFEVTLHRRVRHYATPRFTPALSGDPAPSRAVLWTRLAPDIYEPDGGMPHRRVPVKWRVAKDPGMRRVVRQGVALAVPEPAQSATWSCQALHRARSNSFEFEYRDEAQSHGLDAHRPGERGVGPLAGLRVRLLPGLGPRPTTPPTR